MSGARTEADLLAATRLLVLRLGLPSALGWGEHWVIALTCGPTQPPEAVARFEQTLAAYRKSFPQDVLQFHSDESGGATHCLVLRTGSLAVTHWLAQPTPPEGAP